MSYNELKAYPRSEEVITGNVSEDESLASAVALAGEGVRVLDAGLADGDFRRLLRARGCEVVGTDGDLAASNRVRLREAAGGSEGFDVVAFDEVLARMREPLAVLEEARELLAEGGFLIVSLPNAACEEMRGTILDGGHLRFFTEKSLEDLLLNAGFRTERVKLGEQAAGETARLLARCVPLARGEHTRMLAERYAAVDAELIRIRRSLARHEREAERARTHLHFADTEMRRAQESYAVSERELLAERERCEAYARSLEAFERSENAAEANDLRLQAALAERSAAERLLTLERTEKKYAVEVTALRMRAEAAERAGLEGKAEAAALLARADAAEREMLKRESEFTSLRAGAVSERRLIGYAEAAAAEYQAESVRLGLLIDIVQSSRFWRLKRTIGRIFGCLRARLFPPGAAR
jgi:SAM-dependent methyltransferase